jgi:hypothetical protein
MPLSLDPLKVGQPGQMHSFEFSTVSGTIIPILNHTLQNFVTQNYAEKLTQRAI